MKSLLTLISKDTLTESYDSSVNLKPVIGSLENPSDNLPISPKKFDWTTLESPERLVKSFQFKHHKILKAFLNELIDYQEKLGHHPKIIVEGNIVTIESYTHNVEEITELDLELAKFADLVYQDVQYYFLVKRRERDGQLINHD